MKVEIVIKKRQRRNMPPKGATRTMAAATLICAFASCHLMQLAVHGEQRKAALVAFLVLCGLTFIFLLLLFGCLAARIGSKEL